MDVSSDSSSDEAEPQTSSCRTQEYEDHVNGTCVYSSSIHYYSSSSAFTPLLWIITLDRKCTFQRLHESLCCTLDSCSFFPQSAGNLQDEGPQDDGPEDEGLKVSSKKKANQGIRKRIVTHLTKVLASANLCLLFKKVIRIPHLL